MLTFSELQNLNQLLEAYEIELKERGYFHLTDLVQAIDCVQEAIEEEIKINL